MKRTAFAMAILAYLLSSSVSANTYQKAFKELDCQFKDCSTPKAVEPKVIEKEKIIYVDKPVVQEKVIYVDKPVIQEKVIYVDKPIVVAKPIVKEVEAKKPEAVQEGRQYNTAYVDVTIQNDPKFIVDYISTAKGSEALDWQKLGDKFATAPNSTSWTVKVSTTIEFPEGIDSDYILVKQKGASYRNFTIDGKQLAPEDSYAVLQNKYRTSKKIPFVFYATFCCHSGKSVYDWLNQNLSSIEISFANKVDKRGEKGQPFVPSRFYIEE